MRQHELSNSCPQRACRDHSAMHHCVVVRAQSNQVAELIRAAFRARNDVVYMQREPEIAEPAAMPVANARESLAVGYLARSANRSRLPDAPARIATVLPRPAAQRVGQRLHGLFAHVAGDLDAPIRWVGSAETLAAVPVSAGHRAVAPRLKLSLLRIEDRAATCALEVLTVLSAAGLAGRVVSADEAAALPLVEGRWFAAAALAQAKFHDTQIAES